MASSEDLSIVFSRCLGELLGVLVQDVKLVLKPLEDKVSKKEMVTTKINEVYVGNYPQTRDETTGTVTVSFGNIYQKEIREVLVDLILPKVHDEVDLDALEIVCNYRGDSGNLTSTNPFVFRVKRTSGAETELSGATKAETTSSASRGDVQKMRCYAIPRMDNSPQLLMTRSTKSSKVIPLVPSYHLSATALRSPFTLSQTPRKLSIRMPEFMCGSRVPPVPFITKATMNVFPSPV